MTWWRRATNGKVLKLAGAAVLVGALYKTFKVVAEKPKNRSASIKAESGVSEQSDHPARSGAHELATYIAGYVLALTLTVLAFSMVHWHWAHRPTALWIVFGLALVQIIMHFRCFLHITLHGPARDDLQLIAFSTVIVLLMVGGTLVLLFNLRMRMM